MVVYYQAFEPSKILGAMLQREVNRAEEKGGV